jgi:uncharacterized membrane protein YobD (UPF0266 family)
MNNKHSRATVVVAVLMIICMCALCYGFYKLLIMPTKGQECAIEVQFKDSRVTYLGTII